MRVSLFSIICVGVLLCGGGVSAMEYDAEMMRAVAQSEGWKLDLYYRVDCPYCQKVIRYLTRNGITIGMKDIQRHEGFREELMALAGKTTVPCLCINGVVLFESNDIIKWFEDNIKAPL